MIKISGEIADVSNDEIEIMCMLRNMRKKVTHEITNGLFEYYHLDELEELIKAKEKEILGGFIQKNISIKG